MALPLDGIRVLDFTHVYAGPHATRHLAALGADVVKVESRARPDSTRSGDGDDLSAGSYYNEPNQGKRDATINLGTDRGREIAFDLAAETDVLVENFSPSVMERLGLGYEAVREENEEIVYVSMPGFANSGPAKSYRSWGVNLQSMAGFDTISGHPDDPPVPAAFSWPDPTAGIAATYAICLALLSRTGTGEGIYVEVPQYELTVTFMHKALMAETMDAEDPGRIGNRDEDGRYVQGVYECAGDDRWAAVAIENDAQWARLCEVMGVPELIDDDGFESQYRRFENHDAVDEIITAWTRERSPEEVRSRLQDHDVPAGIVANERDLMEYDPQLRAREYFAEHDHPTVGKHRLQGVPFEMEGEEVQFPSRAPLLGEHTAAVVREWLGMDDQEIERLEEEEVLY